MWEDEQDGVSSGWEVKEEGQLPNGNGHGSNGFYKRPRHVLEWNVERVRVQRGRASMDILHSVGECGVCSHESCALGHAPDPAAAALPDCCSGEGRERSAVRHPRTIR